MDSYYSSGRSKVLSKEHLTAAKELSTNKDIIIRKADKSNIYVILNYEDYKIKLDNILGDTSKF